MKKYDMAINVTLKTQEKETYATPERVIQFSIDEHIPEGVNPIKYLAVRLTEELGRHSKVTTLDWDLEEKTEEEQMTVGTPDEIF